MIATPIPEPIPIYKDEHGRLRITNTRVLLDLVIHAFHLGHTPETITEQYPSLSLDDVYLAIGYYLREQEAEAEAAQRADEARNPPKLTREVLLARLEAKRRQSEG